jgi:wyosine [tRNA(Phe)-imidazoG37] synthetase (radical SAM superfamily)
VADRVVPSLDAVTLDVFQRINRPHPKLELPRILEGLYAFRKDYKKQLYLEVMLASGINDHPEELSQIRRVVDRLCPDRVELNTVVRPPAYAYVTGLSCSEMEAALHFFPAETSGIIGRFEGCAPVADVQDLESRVMELVHRRPCTLGEMAASLGVPLESLSQTILLLQQKKHLISYRFNNLEYYRPPSVGK